MFIELCGICGSAEKNKVMEYEGDEKFKRAVARTQVEDYVADAVSCSVPATNGEPRCQKIHDEMKRGWDAETECEGQYGYFAEGKTYHLQVLQREEA